MYIQHCSVYRTPRKERQLFVFIRLLGCLGVTLFFYILKDCVTCVIDKHYYNHVIGHKSTTKLQIKNKGTDNDLKSDKMSKYCKIFALYSGHSPRCYQFCFTFPHFFLCILFVFFYSIYLHHYHRLPDPGLWRHEPRVGGKRMAAQLGSAPVPFLLHGVTGRCPYARSPHQERT